MSRNTLAPFVLATLGFSTPASAEFINFVDAGGPYTWVQSSGVTFQMASSSFSGDPAGTFGWDLNRDGLVDFSGFQVHLSANQAAVYFGNVGAYQIDARVTDSLGGFAVDTATVNAVSPSGHFNNVAGGAQGPYTMTLGSGIDLIGSPLAVTSDPAGGFGWDLNNDGALDFGTSTVHLDSAQAATFFGSVGTYTVAFRVSDSLGGFALDRTTVTVTSPIPEPETYAMLLAGLMLLGFEAQRRKKLLHTAA